MFSSSLRPHAGPVSFTTVNFYPDCQPLSSRGTARLCPAGRNWPLARGGLLVLRSSFFVLRSSLFILHPSSFILTQYAGQAGFRIVAISLHRFSRQWDSDLIGPLTTGPLAPMDLIS